MMNAYKVTLLFFFHQQWFESKFFITRMCDVCGCQGNVAARSPNAIRVTKLFPVRSSVSVRVCLTYLAIPVLKGKTIDA